MTIQEIIQCPVIVMDTTDDASVGAGVEPAMVEDGLVNFPNEEMKVCRNSLKIIKHCKLKLRLR